MCNPSLISWGYTCCYCRLHPLSCCIHVYTTLFSLIFGTVIPTSSLSKKIFSSCILLIADGHHKLIRWRFDVHGGIDGYSRMIVYLKCSTNNRATAVLECFREAVRFFGLPSHVRSDQGTENTLVAFYMLRHRGHDRRSMITGSSTHNQRIERLWYDTQK